MAHSERLPGNGGRIDCQQPLVRAQLAVRPHPSANCAAVEYGGEAEDITQSLSFDPADEDDQKCHTVLNYDDQPQSYRTADVEENCICPVFEDHDCLTEFRDVSEGTVTVVASVPSRETIRELVGGLREVGATVAVEWLVEDEQRNRTTEMDVSSITSKQREALETALELGYYDSPRDADLGDCADALGITKSAVSQRLNTAETKLVRSFLGRPDKT
ncbi:helix-turn-helix domain-containing protein [Halovenus sp. HT40]|uniref:helix-turn-helix domain-containing protein n=1 Tax=Halovenus sp. HT40 TaxID=3126691 RepID=UPI00300E7CF1